MQGSCVRDTVTAGGSRIPPAPGIALSPGRGLGSSAARAGGAGALGAAVWAALTSSLPLDTGNVECSPGMWSVPAGSAVTGSAGHGQPAAVTAHGNGVRREWHCRAQPDCSVLRFCLLTRLRCH